METSTAKPSSNDNSLALFRDRITDSIETNSRNQRFVPFSRISCLITREVIYQVLSELKTVHFYNINKYIDVVVSKYLRIFSILCLVGAADFLVEYFIQFRLDDTRLPLLDEQLSGLEPRIAKAFKLEQYMFLTPELRRGMIHQVFDDKIVLPFTQEEELLSQGAFGRVYKAGVHEDYQKLVQPHTKNTLFARKEIKKDPDEKIIFAAEKAALEMLMQIKHKHIIELLMTYYHSDSYNLLFPLLDMNLAVYLSLSEYAPTSFRQRIQIWHQVDNIVEALVSIHNYTYEDQSSSMRFLGYHHDLKPQNILVRKETGDFVIADLGLARFKPSEATSKTVLRHGTNGYGPPESHKRIDDHRPIISRKFDVWSLACILTELVTFVYLGPKGVVDFNDIRTTADPDTFSADDWFHDRKDVKKEVLEWLDWLDKKACDGIFSSGLIQLLREMLKGDPRERPDSSVVLRTFRCLLAKLESSVDSDSGGVQVTGLEPAYQEPEVSHLYAAAESGDTISFASVLSRTARAADVLSWKDNHDRNAVHLIAMQNNLRMLEEIAHQGIDIAPSILAQDSFGNMPLHLATQKGSSATLDRLMALVGWNTAEYNLAVTMLEVDNKGRSILHCAALNGDVLVTKVIIDWASRAPQVLPLLMEHQDDKGRTALEIARANDRNDVVNILKA